MPLATHSEAGVFMNEKPLVNSTEPEMRKSQKEIEVTLYTQEEPDSTRGEDKHTAQRNDLNSNANVQNRL